MISLASEESVVVQSLHTQQEQLSQREQHDDFIALQRYHENLSLASYLDPMDEAKPYRPKHSTG